MDLMPSVVADEAHEGCPNKTPRHARPERQRLEGPKVKDIILEGPSPHLSWWELGCRDGSPYPTEWRTNRAIELARAFEMVRELCGFPLIVDSAYRTEEYNRRPEVNGAKNSQHVQGRALDLKPHPPSKAALKRLEAAARRTRDLGLLKGIGVYSGFIHIDVRPGQAATWYGSRGPESDTK